MSVSGLPNVFATAGESEGLEAHRFQRDVTGENHEVGPGDLPAILLLDRPEQPARLIEVHIVGPAIEGREALFARACSAATVADAIRTGAVPRHTNEQVDHSGQSRRATIPASLSSRHEGP